MSEPSIPEFAVIGHPNEGKSSVVSTLAEDDSVTISPVPGETLKCRTFPVRIDNEEIIRFTDTPGFQRPRQALKWMRAYSGPEEKRIAAFCEAHRNDPEMQHECELLAPVARGAGIIFVVDGSRPIRNNDRMEIEILRLTGYPRMAVVNSKGRGDEYLSEWKNEFRKSFNAVRVFNAHSATYAERIALLESLKAIDQDRQELLERVISAFQADWEKRNLHTADLICDLLTRCLKHQVEKTYSEAGGEKEAKQQLQQIYQTEIASLESKAHDQIRRLFKHNIFRLDLPSESVVHETIFSSRTWKFLGLKPTQLAAAAAVGGGLIGAKLDLATAGLTHGVLTAVGSVVAAGSAYLFGERMATAKVVGVRFGGYTVIVGPHKGANFPFILLDRALIIYTHVINWAHGRRDYPKVASEQQPFIDRKEGFTAAWTSEEKKICQAFFTAVRNGDQREMESRRLRMAEFLTMVLQKISRKPAG